MVFANQTIFQKYQLRGGFHHTRLIHNQKKSDFYINLVNFLEESAPFFFHFPKFHLNFEEQARYHKNPATKLKAVFGKHYKKRHQQKANSVFHFPSIIPEIFQFHITVKDMPKNQL